MFLSDRVGRGGCLAAAVGVSMLAAPPGPAAADTFPAACSGTSGDAASLIAAIKKANDQAGADTVQLGNRCLYVLTLRNNYWYGPNGLPAIASDITIDGNGSTIARSPFAQGFRLFFVGARRTSSDTENYVTPGEGRLTLRDLTLEGGVARGGASNAGGGGGGMGGAIFSQGTVTIERSTLQGNAAVGGAGNDTTVGRGGGGIGTDSHGTNGGGAGELGPNGMTGRGLGKSPYGGGGVGLRGEAGADGTAGGAGGGPQTGLGGAGGGSQDGTAGARGGDGAGGGGRSDLFPSTESTGDGGGFGEGGHGAPGGTSSQGSGGGGVGGGGGGGGRGFDIGEANDFRSGGGGGGFGGGGGQGGEQDGGGGQGGFGGGGGSSDNVHRVGAAGFGGGTGTITDGGGGAGLGGAIFSMQGRLTITNSTLTGNSAIGGADNVTDHGKGIGGAVFNLSGSFLSVASTFAGDTAAYDGTEIYNLVYDGVTTHTAQTTLRDTIVDGAQSPFALVADDPLNTASVPNMGTAAADLRQSDLVRSRAQHGSAQLTGSPLTSDPQLGALKDNGGPTQTMEPAAGSPVIDAGAAFGLTTDQRGLPRPADVMTIPNVGDGSDIGAVEVQIAAVPTFGAATRVTLGLGSKRIPAKGPLPIVVTNLNPFQVTGRLSGQTASKVRVKHKKPRRIVIKAKALTLAANGKSTVELVLPQSLRDLLKKTGKLRLSLSAAVRDPAGNVRTVTQTVIPRRKK